MDIAPSGQGPTERFDTDMPLLHSLPIDNPYGRSAVDARSFPRLPLGAVGEDADTLKELTPVVSDFNSSIWKLKKDSGLSLKSPISNISIPPELSMLEDSLVRMHSIE